MITNAVSAGVPNGIEFLSPLESLRLGIQQPVRRSRIIVHGRAALLFIDDVFDGEQSLGHCLGNEAILAAFARTFTHKSTQRGGDVGLAHDRSPQRLALNGPSLGQANEVLDVLVSFPFPLFLGGESPVAALRQQLFDSTL